MTLSKKFVAIALAFLMNFIFFLPIDYAFDGVPEKAEGEIRVISYNVRCASDLYGSVNVRSRLVFSLLNKYQPDSFGVQEATSKWMRLLSKKMKDYDYVGELRDGSKPGSEASAVFYLKDKYNLIDSGTIWLSDTPDVKYTKYESSGCTRIASWATLENKETGYTYTHINTHLDHVSEEARVMQIKVLEGKIKELSKRGCPIICTGDFNAAEGSAEYETMTAFMKDSKHTAEETDKGITFHNYGRREDNNVPIDFIFLSDDVQATRYRIMDERYKDKVFLSDHYGLCVDFKEVK